MDPVKKVPGLTFHVEHSELKSKLGIAELHADVEDPDMWDAVLEKLDGYRVYTVKDLQESVLEVLQSENKEEKAEHARREEAMRQELECLRQENSLLKKTNAELAKEKGERARELQQLKEMKLDLEEFGRL